MPGYADGFNTAVLVSYTYGDSNERLITDEGGYRTYYVSDGGTVIAEYSETPGLPTTPTWSKSYVYLGGRLLSTLTPNGSGGEAVNYHHPDRLGTRLVSDPVAGTSFEQVTLPFGIGLNAESTGATNRRFTSYDRSTTSGLDYAVNRNYDSQQGRFTQVDPIGMKSTSLSSPQTLNLYAYCANDPINHSDPSGLGFFSFLKKLFKKVLQIVIDIAVVFLVTTGIGLIAAGGILSFFAGVGLFLGATYLAGKVIGDISSAINQFIHRCRVPDFAGLSQRRQEELKQRGINQSNGINCPTRRDLPTLISRQPSPQLVYHLLDGWWIGLAEVFSVSVFFSSQGQVLLTC